MPDLSWGRLWRRVGDGGRFGFEGVRARGGAPVVEARGAPVVEGRAAAVVLLSRFKGT